MRSTSLLELSYFLSEHLFWLLWGGWKLYPFVFLYDCASIWPPDETEMEKAAQKDVFLSDMNSFIIPCEEEEEEEEEEKEKEKDYSNTDKEEAYDDIESFDTPSVTFSQDFTLDLDKEEPMVQNKECIYEVLPGESFKLGILEVLLLTHL